jgi:ABC-type Fe3+ transport system substrate-binding protein
MRIPKRLASLVVASAVVLTAAACGSGSDDSSSAKPTHQDLMTDPAWDGLIKAAQKEGELVVTLGSSTIEAEAKVYDQFEKDFGIKVTITQSAGTDAVDRILAERSQKRYTVDLSGQGPTGTTRLLEAKALDEIDKYFVLDEVKDRSTGWRVDYVPFSSEDADKKYVTYYAMDLSTNAFRLWYNTDKVKDVESIKSWQDLLDPKYKGKIVIGDVAGGEAGADRTNAWILLGQDYWDKLLSDQDVKVIAYGQAREFADSLARGQYDFGMFPGGGEQALIDGKDLGLPVDEFPHTMSEGTVAAPTRNLAVFTDPPHPNAAKLFVNWYLSKAGQATYNDLNERPGLVALRNDVPQGHVPDEVWAKAESPETPITDLNTDDFRAADKESFAWWKQTTQDLGVAP